MTGRHIVVDDLSAEAIASRLVTFLIDESGLKNVLDAWPGGAEQWSNWTKLMTTALVRIGTDLCHAPQVAARGFREHNPSGKSEHLSLDVVGYGGPLMPIVFAAEHENTGDISVMRYQAWKLLNINAPVRVLVGYCDSSATMPNAMKTPEQMFDATKDQVVTNFPGQRLLVIAVNRTVRPQDAAAVAAAFHHREIVVSVKG